MPVYTYRREDGTTFEIKQKFSDDPLTIDPETGQEVKRIVQAPGVIFKGSGFYVNDSRKAKNPASPAAKSENGTSTKSETDKAAKSKSDEKPKEKTTTSTE